MWGHVVTGPSLLFVTSVKIMEMTHRTLAPSLVLFICFPWLLYSSMVDKIYASCGLGKKTKRERQKMV